MELTEARLTRATLARQLLLDRNELDVVAATHQVPALQAQDPASPYIALWNRDFDPAALDTAIAFAALPARRGQRRLEDQVGRWWAGLPAEEVRIAG